MQKFKAHLIVSIPEMILLVILFLGYSLKIQHIPATNIILTIDLLTLATVYMIGGCFMFSNLHPKILLEYKSWPTYSILKMIFGIGAGLTMACWIITSWAKIMHLPIMQGYLFISAALGVLVTLFCIGVSIKFPRIWLCYLRVFVSFSLTLIPSLFV